MNTAAEKSGRQSNENDAASEALAVSSPRRPAAVDVRPALIDRIFALWYAEFLSPKDLVRRAAVIAMLFVVAHLLGLGDFASILNGTTGSMALGWGISAFLGLLYIFLYLAFVLIAPVLVLTAAVLVAWRRFRS